MEEILKELILKFNACKEDGLSYYTYKDKELEEAFAKAEKFLQGNSEEEETKSKK